MSIDVRKAEGGIGAEIRDVDLRTISDSDFSSVYRAFLDHLVLVVRDQTFTIPQFLAYSRRFGALTPNVIKKTRHPDYPELTVMGEKVRADGSVDSTVLKRGEGWHTDTAFLPKPAKATQLYALEIPSYGGDTLFANMYAAYDALPPPLQERIAGLEALFCNSGKNKAANDLMDQEERDRAPVRHRIVQVHPETGRTFLYVNPVHLLRMADMEEDEGEALLQELYSYIVQPGYEYRHSWRAGDVVIWDNRCCIHSATGGYPVTERRIHWRTMIMADAAATSKAAA